MDVMCREYSTFTGLLGIEGRNVTVFMTVEGDCINEWHWYKTMITLLVGKQYVVDKEFM